MFNKSPILHVILSTWLFISSSGLLLNAHFCGDLLRSAGLEDQSESCEMHAKTIAQPSNYGCCSLSTQNESSEMQCHLTSSMPKQAKDDCCSDVYVSFNINLLSSQVNQSHLSNPELLSELFSSKFASQQVVSLQRDSQEYLNQLTWEPSYRQPNQRVNNLDIPLQKQSFLN